MSMLFNCQNLTKSYGRGVLFENLSLSISKGDRIGLVGLNGCGKSTLLKILAGIETLDSGELAPRRGITIGYVPQDCEFSDISPKKVLQEALKNHVEEYEAERLAKIQLDRFGFTGKEKSASKLSGGWKKRLYIAKELITSPDVLLLDEPTNHLDLEGIIWLEKFLTQEAVTYLVVSHDRYFLQHVTNKIIEIDKVYPQGVMVIDGSYKNFLYHKQKFLEAQLEQERSLSGKARRETDWLRAGVKARTTKAKSRIDEANVLFERLVEVKKRNKQQHAKIDFAATERETRKLVVAKNIAKEIEGKPLFKNLDFTLSPGSRIGLMGPNGCGKTTLLKIIAEEIESDTGTLKRAEDLKVVYFDQHRMKIPLDATLKEALSPNSDYVFFRGHKIHINGWAKRFLFSPDLLQTPIAKLSGGERARITIAHLMLQPADILLLDEPTNDLDIPTLETLEESLKEFSGALVLISHDRCMLDRICNSIIAFKESNKTQIFSDYKQWEASNSQENIPKEIVKANKTSKSSISYAKKKEMDAIERKIAKLENEVKDLNYKLEDVEIANNPKKLSQICDKIGVLETKISSLYLSWEELT